MIKKIISENPIFDIWQMILHYSYPNNIIKYYKQNKREYEIDIIDIVVNSLLQANEFFQVSNEVSLNILPMVLYYGATNLFNGLLTLISGKELPIKTHGLKLIMTENEKKGIGPLKIQILNPNNGALSNFLNKIDPNTQNIDGQVFSFAELLGSIPSLKYDFENCYEELKPNCIPVEKVKINDSDIERISFNELTRFENKNIEIFRNIKNFEDNYLEPQITNNYFVLRKKIKSKEIGIFDEFGKKYFQLGINKSKRIIHLPQPILFLICLYSLSNLARYYPKFWNPFINNDSTGERQIIEKFLHISKRYLPNLLLNVLNNKILIFIRSFEEEIIIKRNDEEKELKELIRKEINKILKIK